MDQTAAMLHAFLDSLVTGPFDFVALNRSRQGRFTP
jgi:hypothetical protein